MSGVGGVWPPDSSNRISAILSTGITVSPGSGETAGGVRLTAGTTYLPNVFGSVAKVGVASDPKRVGPASRNLEYG